MFTKEKTSKIKHQLKQAETVNDLLDLLNLAYQATGIRRKFKLENILLFLNYDYPQRYNVFEIKKKAGGTRTIYSPCEELKELLKALNIVFQSIYNCPLSVYGFVRNKSIVDNAKKHVGNQYLLNIDLKDFFYSFNLKKVSLGILKEVFDSDLRKSELAMFIARLVTHPLSESNDSPVLPQGSPVSPILTNILMAKFDEKLSSFCKTYNVSYSRYADDITFSAPTDIVANRAFFENIKFIIEKDEDFLINPKKTRLQHKRVRQEVTGLIVNDVVNVNRSYIKELRMWLYYWESYGYNKAEKFFKHNYQRKKGCKKNIDAKMKNVLAGRLNFLAMVKGKNNTTYLQLKNRFEKLLE